MPRRLKQLLQGAEVLGLDWAKRVAEATNNWEKYGEVRGFNHHELRFGMILPCVVFFSAERAANNGENSWFCKQRM
jgi:hypothetical protein